MTIRHLLPTLQQKCEWPEKKRKVILVGTRAEVPLLHRTPRKPILDPIKPGSMVLGYELHRSTGLKVGDKVTFMGRTFTISKCLPERGSKDDISMWINLAEAQELLGKKGKINGILALSCMCQGAQLGKVREEVTRILPDTQVVEFASKALARAEARRKAKETHLLLIEKEKAHRRKLRKEWEESAAILVPLVVLGAFVWIALLAFANVRERRNEIGILRALGLRTWDIFSLFLSRAVLVGFLGAVGGYAGGLLVGGAWGAASFKAHASTSLFDPRVLLLVCVAAPFLSAVASWLPALFAAQQDPAMVLREE